MNKMQQAELDRWVKTAKEKNLMGATYKEMWLLVNGNNAVFVVDNVRILTYEEMGIRNICHRKLQDDGSWWCTAKRIDWSRYYERLGYHGYGIMPFL